jgi:predicted  nucleic acid-binding Zn-ribbon protein
MIRELLILQDIEVKIREIRSYEYKEKTGFEIDESKIKELENYKRKIESELSPKILKKFYALLNKYGRAIALVYNDACSNCFSKVPVGQKSSNNEEIRYCNFCGVMLYFP